MNKRDSLKRVILTKQRTLYALHNNIVKVSHRRPRGMHVRIKRPRAKIVRGNTFVIVLTRQQRDGQSAGGVI